MTEFPWTLDKETIILNTPNGVMIECLAIKSLDNKVCYVPLSDESENDAKFIVALTELQSFNNKLTNICNDVRKHNTKVIQTLIDCFEYLGVDINQVLKEYGNEC